MTEGSVVGEDIFLRDTFRDQVGPKDPVRRARVNIVGAKKCELLHPKLGPLAVNRRDRLLVWRSTGVEDVLRRVLALVLNRAEQEAVQVLDHRPHRLAADRGPAAEHHVDVRHGHQLARPICERRSVRGRVDDNLLRLLAKMAALGVLRLDQHEHGVLQSGLSDCHRTRQRMQDADLDRVSAPAKAMRGTASEAAPEARGTHPVSFIGCPL